MPVAGSGVQGWIPGFLVVSKGRSHRQTVSPRITVLSLHFSLALWTHFFRDNHTPSPKMEPTWSQNGSPKLVSTIFLEPCFRATLRVVCSIVWCLPSPTCPRNLFCFVCFAPPPQTNNMNLICLEILVSFWVPVRGGITHFSGSVCLHSRTEREFCKITPTKQMVFEAISGASAHLGSPRSQNGPGHPPRSPNDPQNMIFYPFFSIFWRFFDNSGSYWGCFRAAPSQKQQRAQHNTTQTPTPQETTPA